MIPITNDILAEMHFMKHLYNEVCEFIDSMILCGGRTGHPDSLLHDDEVTLSEAVNMWNNLEGLEVREHLKQETEEE